MPQTQKQGLGVWISVAKQLVVSVVWTYFAVVVVTFVVSLFVSLTGLWPSTWRVPWSGVGSYVETKDHKILVDIGMWGRIEVYDSSGDFVQSWKAPAIKGELAIATDENGGVYFRRANTIFKLGQDGQIEAKFESKAPVPRNWILSAQSAEPQYVGARNEFSQRKVTAKGDSLFSENESRDFLCQDGTRLERRGSLLVRLSRAGEQLQVYSAPRYYWLVQFPFPALIGCIAGSLLVFLGIVKNS